MVVKNKGCDVTCHMERCGKWLSAYHSPADCKYNLQQTITMTLRRCGVDTYEQALAADLRFLDTALKII